MRIDKLSPLILGDYLKY